MNPFFIFLAIAAIVAVIFWFRNATKKQGVIALKSIFIILAVFIVILIATGRLPIVSGIPFILLALFKRFALNKLLIPFIRLLAGSYQAKGKKTNTVKMNKSLALTVLGLSENPSREEIVKAHRQRIRELQNESKDSAKDIATLDAAREFLLEDI